MNHPKKSSRSSTSSKSSTISISSSTRRSAAAVPPPPPKPFDDIRQCIACVEEGMSTLLRDHAAATHRIVRYRDTIERMLCQEIGTPEACRSAVTLNRKTNLEANLAWAHDFLIGMLQSGVKPYLEEAKETMADAEAEGMETGEALDEKVYFPLLLDYLNRAAGAIQTENTHYYFIVDNVRQELDLMFHFSEEEEEEANFDEDYYYLSAASSADEEPAAAVVTAEEDVNRKLKAMVAAAVRAKAVGDSAARPIKAILSLLYETIGDELIAVFSQQRLPSLIKQLNAYVCAYSATGTCYHHQS